MKKGRQNKKGEIEYRKSEPKVIRVNFSLVVGIIVVILILCTSFVGHKMSIISTKVLSNLVEEVTDEDDTWKIVNISESEEDTGKNESENSENQDTQSTSEESGENVNEEDMAEENTTEGSSSNEEQIASASESSDDEASAVSNEDVTYTADDGVSTASISKSSIYDVGASTINYIISDFSDYSSLSYSGDLKKYTTDDRNCYVCNIC